MIHRSPLISLFNKFEPRCHIHTHRNIGCNAGSAQMLIQNERAFIWRARCRFRTHSTLAACTPYLFEPDLILTVRKDRVKTLLMVYIARHTCNQCAITVGCPCSIQGGVIAMQQCLFYLFPVFFKPAGAAHMILNEFPFISTARFCFRINRVAASTTHLSES